jgi:hypothetical protein
MSYARPRDGHRLGDAEPSLLAPQVNLSLDALLPVRLAGKSTPPPAAKPSPKRKKSRGRAA